MSDIGTHSWLTTPTAVHVLPFQGLNWVQPGWVDVALCGLHGISQQQACAKQGCPCQQLHMAGRRSPIVLCCLHQPGLLACWQQCSPSCFYRGC
jgi:hypothetical protein